jgi:hypothetical protein
MNFQTEMTKVSRTIDSMYAERLDVERQHKRLSSSIVLADLQPAERAAAPVVREKLIEHIAAIDRELAKADGESKRLNAAHLTAATIAREPSVKHTAELKRATGTVEDLEQRRQTVATMIHSLETDRAKVILAAQTGDAKAKGEADRMSRELIGLIRDAADIELALTQARDQLKAAQADANAVDGAKRADEGRKIGSIAVTEAAEFDRLIIRAVEILDHRAARTDQLLKLGAIDHTRANRIRGQRVILGALIRAGMKRHVGDLNSISGAAWLAETDRVLFPTIERAPAKAA